MRLFVAASAMCLDLLLFPAWGAMASPGAASAAAAPAPAPAPATDDAARHAKRTACLKEAKTKKLIGADRNAFVKSCTAAP